MNQFHIAENNFTILIVDDSESSVRLLSFVLREAGYKVLVAFNGGEAKEIVEQRSPDLILMDVLMPDISGYELTSEIRENSELEEIPIIFITALSELDDKLNAFKAGGVDHISKPFQKDEVLARIKTHLYLQQLVKERDARITQLKNQEIELRELDQKKSELLRLVSHDMYNPLLSINGIAEMINQSSEASSEITELNQLIINSSQKLILLVDRLLNNEDQLQLTETINIAPSNLDDLFERIIAINKPKSVLKNIRLFKNLAIKSSVYFIDEVKLEIAINNLISNSLKFTPKGGEIKILVSETDSNLEILVVDTGIGIPDTMIDFIFTDPTKTKQTGTDGEIGRGLGLDVVQDYIHLHNGTIKVNSKENQGTEFIIQIPLGEK